MSRFFYSSFRIFQSVEEATAAIGVVNPVMLVVDDSCRGWVPELQGDSALPVKYHVLMGESPCHLSGNGTGEQRFSGGAVCSSYSSVPSKAKGQ